MNSIVDDLFTVESDAIVIPTNGCIKKGGLAVTGKGLAKEASERFEGFSKALGRNLKLFGNIPAVVGTWDNKKVLNFPTKPGYVTYGVEGGPIILDTFRSKAIKGSTVPGWMFETSIDMIRTSAERLVELTDSIGLSNVVLPAVGCGEGNMNLLDVTEILEQLLDSRFTLVIKKEG